ncbi:hypothetical protein OG589_06540 [Sphaerisporangium sp. NBC_01403]|uniref:hypothetical protein n=1 Tax=Sphaerisporangium sp. NBC_01403 TaxID=2903599 RepID=UPI00325087CE
MRSTIRTAWIAVGGALTALTVIGMALWAWTDIRLPHDYDFAFPGSYDSSDLGRLTTETSTVTYAITTPLVIVDATGRVGVRFVPGAAGRLSVRRELTWRDGDRRFSEAWESGRTLRVSLTCAGGSGCRGDYTLGVPPGVEVLLTTPTGTVRCSPASPGAPCPPPRLTF